MEEKVEVTIEVILHATEDERKIFDSFLELFGIEESEFAKERLVGHYENPIAFLRVKITKNKARNFIKKLASHLPQDQLSEVIDDMENRIQDSMLHIRLGKQELVRRNLVLQENDAVKVKIHTPVYSKKDTVKIYTSLLAPS
ncbi:MAG: RNA-binding domain-containing protein [Nitrosopumilaceae archaeon]